MTFENALKKIQARFENIDASKLADMAVQVTLTDEDCGGILYFKSENGTVDVQGYDYRDNDAAVEIERKALMDVLAGKMTLNKAIEKGQATAKGNFEKLDTLEIAIPKYVAPSRKTAVKEATVKPAVKAEPVKADAVKPAKAAACEKKTCARKSCAKIKLEKRQKFLMKILIIIDSLMKYYEGLFFY